MSGFNHVLVGLDLNESSADVLLGCARQIADPDRIEAIHACENIHQEHHEYHVGSFKTSEELDDAVRREAYAFMERVCRSAGVHQHTVLDGPRTPALHSYARNRADLIVVGSHGRHGLAGIVGSTSNGMLHGTECDVLAVHLPESNLPAPRTYDRILAAIDLSENSFQVLEHAQAVAHRCDARLMLCHVSHSPSEHVAEREFDRLLHYADTYGVEPEDVYEPHGVTAKEIHGLATELDVGLVVVGNRGKHGLALLRGSEANAVLHGTTCDELSVRIN